MPNRTIALVTDLIFATKIRSTAQAVGAHVELVRDAAGLRAALDGGPVRQVFVDLNAERLDLTSVISTVRERSPVPRIVAYLSHVQADLAAAARQAGADDVLARSAFSARLPELLQSLDDSSA